MRSCVAREKVCARDQEVSCEEMDPRKSLKPKEMENDIKLKNRIIGFLKKNQSKQILYKGRQMQSEVKGVEEKQIHGWWIHLERFDGLRIPQTIKGEWVTLLQCEEEKELQLSCKDQIPSTKGVMMRRVWRTWHQSCTQNHWFLEPQNRAELNPWHNTIRAEVGEEKTSRNLLERSFDIWGRMHLEHC